MDRVSRPYKIGSSNVWEIWTFTQSKKNKNDWTPQTRWWLEEENGSKLYFPYFSDLAPYLNNQTEAFKLKRISLDVASFAFIAAVCAIIYWVLTRDTLTNRDTFWLAMTAIAGLVASGGQRFFGVWRQP